MEQLPKDKIEEFPLVVASENKEKVLELPELPNESVEKVQEAPATPEEIERVLSMTETVTKQVRERELARDQERWGKGTFGKVKKWLNTTDVGRGVKMGGKIALGTLAAIAATGLTGGIGLLAAPALFAVGTSIAAGGAAEGLMHIAGTKEGFFKSGRNERIQIDSKREMLKKIADESFSDLIAHAQEFTLKDLTERADELVKVIRDKESEITEIESKNIKREKGRKLIAGLVGKAAAGGVGLLHGIPLGTQDFDKNGVSHSVRLMKTGFDSIYNQNEAVAQVAGQATAGVHALGALAGGGASHTIGGLGGFNGWWNVAGAAVGLAAAGGALAKETYDDVKNFRRNDDLRDQGNYVDPYKIITDKFKHPLDPKQKEITDSQTALLEGKEPLQLAGDTPPLLEGKEPKQLTGPIDPRFVGLKSSTEAPKQSDSPNDLLENTVKEPKQLTGPIDPRFVGLKSSTEAPKQSDSANDLFENIEEFNAAKRIIEFENKNMEKFDEQFTQGGKSVTRNKLSNIKQKIIGGFNHGQSGQRFILYGNMRNVGAFEKQMDIIRKENNEQKKSNPGISEPVFRVIFSAESEIVAPTTRRKTASSVHVPVQVRNFLRTANAGKSTDYEILKSSTNLTGYINDLLLQKEYLQKGIRLVSVESQPVVDDLKPDSSIDGNSGAFTEGDPEELSGKDNNRTQSVNEETANPKVEQIDLYEPYTVGKNIDDLTHQLLIRAQQGDQTAIESSEKIHEFLKKISLQRGEAERDAQMTWLTDPGASVIRFKDIKNHDLDILARSKSDLKSFVRDKDLQEIVWDTLNNIIGPGTDRLKAVLSSTSSRELLKASASSREVK